MDPNASDLLYDAWDADALRGARVEVFDDLRACEEVWRRAAGRCACTLFQTYDWLAAWRAALATPERLSDAIVHVAGREGATLLLLPLGVFRRSGGRCLEFLGGDLCDYNGPVVDRALARDISRRDVARLWRIVLARLPAADWLSLRRMPRMIDGVPNPLASLDCRPGGAAFAARLPQSFEAFVGARSRSFFAQNRRHRRRLDKAGTVTVSFPEAPEQRLALLRFCVERKALWQRKRGLACTFGQGCGGDGYGALYDHLTRSGLPGAEIVPAGLMVDGRIVAALWGVVFRGSFLFLVTSYDEDWAEYRVGRLLMEDVVRDCIARGLAVFDLTTGAEPYKANWADTTAPVLDHVAARTLLGALMLRARAARRSLRRAASLGRLAALPRRWRADPRPARLQAGE